MHDVVFKCVKSSRESGLYLLFVLRGMFALNESACKTLQCTSRRRSNGCAAVINSVGKFPMQMWRVWKNPEDQFER